MIVQSIGKCATDWIWIWSLRCTASKFILSNFSYRSHAQSNLNKGLSFKTDNSTTQRCLSHRIRIHPSIEQNNLLKKQTISNKTDIALWYPTSTSSIVELRFWFLGRARAPLESVSSCTRFSGFSTISSFGLYRLSSKVVGMFFWIITIFLLKGFVRAGFVAQICAKMCVLIGTIPKNMLTNFKLKRL